MDKITKEQRSETMRHVHSKNTKPELYVRRKLWRCGLRYRICDPKIPGKPDIYLPKYHCAVFVHGCFWHRHEGCRHTTTPQNNYEYWQNKFTSNVNRDIKIRDQLNTKEIKVIVIWECTVNRAIKEKDDLFLNRLYNEIVYEKNLYVEF